MSQPKSSVEAVLAATTPPIFKQDVLSSLQAMVAESSSSSW